MATTLLEAAIAEHHFELASRQVAQRGEAHFGPAVGRSYTVHLAACGIVFRDLVGGPHRGPDIVALSMMVA